MAQEADGANGEGPQKAKVVALSTFARRRSRAAPRPALHEARTWAAPATQADDDSSSFGSVAGDESGGAVSSRKEDPAPPAAPPAAGNPGRPRRVLVLDHLGGEVEDTDRRPRGKLRRAGSGTSLGDKPAIRAQAKDGVGEEEAYQRGMRLHREIEEALLMDHDDEGEMVGPAYLPDSPSSEVGGFDGHLAQLRKLQELKVQNTLVGMAMFDRCCQAFIDTLAASVTVRAYYPGEDVVKEHAEGSSMLVVLTGSINMLIDDEKVSSLREGQYIGEMLVLGLEDEWPVRVAANPSEDDETVIMEITREVLDRALAEFPDECGAFEATKLAHRFTSSEGTLVHTWELFKSIKDRTLCAIDARMVNRLFFPGEKILKEGEPAEDLFILAKGWVSVELEGRVVREETTRNADPKEPKEPAVFGALGLLGIQSISSCTVVAQSVCRVRILYRTIFQDVLREGQESLNMKGFEYVFKSQSQSMGHQHLQAKRCLGQFPIFKNMGCSEPFLDYLAQHLEDRVFLTGQRIIDDTKPFDRCLYVLRMGSVKVIKDGQVVANLSGEHIFGELAVMGFSAKRLSSVVATSMCYAQALSQSIFLKGLEMFPDEREKVLSLAYDSMAQGNPDAAAAVGTGGEPGSPGTAQRSPFREVAINRALKECSLFTETGPQFAEEVKMRAKERIYMPGDLVIEEGHRGESMFLVISGEAHVYVNKAKTSLFVRKVAVPGEEGEASSKGRALDIHMSNLADQKPFDITQANKVATLTSGSITGELAMLGVSHFRTATIQAATICFCWELTRKDAHNIFDHQPDVRKHFEKTICRNLDNTVPECIFSLPLFQDFDRQFLTLIVLNCERRAYFPKQVVVQDGRQGEGLYIINRGVAVLEKRGVEIKTLTAGSHWGGRIMLGVTSTCICSLVAQQTCHVIVVTRTSYQTAFQLHPSPGAEAELRKAEDLADKAIKMATWRAARLRALRSLGSSTTVISKHAGMLRAWHLSSATTMLKRAYAAWAQQAERRRHVQRARAHLVLETSCFVLKSERAREYSQKRTARFDLNDRWPLVPTRLEPVEAEAPPRSPGRPPPGGAGRIPVISRGNPYCAELAAHLQDPTMPKRWKRDLLKEDSELMARVRDVLDASRPRTQPPAPTALPFAPDHALIGAALASLAATPRRR